MIFRRHLLSVIYFIILTLTIYILHYNDDILNIISTTKLKYLGMIKKEFLRLKGVTVTELSLSLSAMLHDKQNQETLARIMQKNVTSLTESDLAQFYSIKEAQYEARRARVQAYCRTQHGGNFSRRIYQYLLYDKKACAFTTIFKYLINI